MFAVHVVARTRVRHRLEIKPVAFILYADVDAMIAHVNVDLNFLAPIELVAMLGGVYNDFVDEKLRAVGFVPFSVELLGGKRVSLINQPVEP